ncbi:MAG: DNA mismatch repair protein MutS [Deltaproteobacteria bacterium]|nr:DNA mismatch repair protein MutS [Deltaproteobacteria bacterium]
MSRRPSQTPMMKQYRALKERAGDALLLFRMGDFYELFSDDAERVAPLLDLVLTTRDRDTPNAVPMCGVPVHAIEGYIRKLLQLGHAVAIAEQMEDPKLAKGLVRREIVEVVTPGLVLDPQRLDGSGANYVAAVLQDGETLGLAYLDLSTGEFQATQMTDPRLLEAELDRVSPREVLLRDTDKSLPVRAQLRRAPDADFDPGQVAERVGRLPDGIHRADTSPLARAVAAVWSMVAELQPFALEQLQRVRRYEASDRLLLDPTTRRHLELVRNLQDGGLRGTLLELLDHSRTPMGHRQLVSWISEPLVDLDRIRSRQQRVEEWLEPDSRRAQLADALRRVGDLERLLTRSCLPVSGPRDLAALRDALAGVQCVQQLRALSEDLSGLQRRLEQTLVEAPPQAPRGEPYTGYIRDGVAAELDRVRAESEEGHGYLASLEERERERTGIPTLKVKYNRVFGYSIEVTKRHLSRVPEHYRRKQTITNAERFTSDELQRWEGVVLSARERAAAVEASVLGELRAAVARAAEQVRRAAREIAELDVAQSLATVARQHDFVRPELDRSLRIQIEAGRHPVVERFTPDGFIPNDLILDADDARFIILTGPNMAGKSTLLRQTALIVLLAQMGSYVPARSARIGVVDRIFTRVGAQDSLTSGDSTFMVEMRETATILHEATPRSLVLLDEIGRGTSTFDGLSIAWAVVEYLHDTPGLRVRALFATHYHELADMARTKPFVRNFHFRCAERGGEILFLRRMEPGAASRSYGIEVARRAGLPPEVIRRAREVLANLEGGEFDERGKPRLAREGAGTAPSQLGLFQGGRADPLRQALRKLEPDDMTPIESMLELSRLKQLAEEEV